MTKSVGIVLSRVVVNSDKREVKLLSVEEMFNSASGLQKLESVEEITISGKRESKMKFEKGVLFILFKLGHGFAVCIVVP